MEWSHINNECNDGKDNDPKSLGEGHSSYSKKTYDKVNTKKIGS